MHTYIHTYIHTVSRLRLYADLAVWSVDKRGEGTADWDTAASNRSTGNCLSNFHTRISSKTRIHTFEFDEGFQPYHPPSELSSVLMKHVLKLLFARHQVSTRIAASHFPGSACLHMLMCYCCLFMCIYCWLVVCVYVCTYMYTYIYIYIYIYCSGSVCLHIATREAWRNGTERHSSCRPAVRQLK